MDQTNLSKETLLKLLSNSLAHTCSGSKMLCCNAIFCETCYIQHLKLTHPPEVFIEFQKYLKSESLLKPELKESKLKLKKSNAKKARTLTERVENLSDEEYNRLKTFFLNLKNPH